MYNDVKVYWGHKKTDREEFMRHSNACTILGELYDYVDFAVSPSFEQAVPIIIADDLMEQGKTLFASAMVCGIHGKDYTIIALNYRFYSDLTKNEQLESLVDHGLGHICCGHLDNTTLSEVQKERIDQQLTGGVVREELEADHFAMNRRKKADVVYALRYMMNHMDWDFDGLGVGEKWRQAAKQEVENRMRMLGKWGDEGL